jgi:carboxylesterase type B
MVFFHGGRYEQGSAGVNLFDGAQIANYTNTIVVTVRRLS